MSKRLVFKNSHFDLKSTLSHSELIDYVKPTTCLEATQVAMIFFVRSDCTVYVQNLAQKPRIG